jgi:nitrite reductase (NADH) small subunit/3-phenylpropionate/trans-cinnamate dioxygenase ferredoxin subunit
MPEFVKVADTSEIAPGRGKAYVVGKKEVAVFNVGGKFFAIDNSCGHVGAPLAEGEMDGPIVTCPWHGWQWNVATGVNAHDSSCKMPTYPVKVENGAVMVAAE